MQTTREKEEEALRRQEAILLSANAEKENQLKQQQEALLKSANERAEELKMQVKRKEEETQVIDV